MHTRRQRPRSRRHHALPVGHARRLSHGNLENKSINHEICSRTNRKRWYSYRTVLEHRRRLVAPVLSQENAADRPETPVAQKDASRCQRAASGGNGKNGKLLTVRVVGVGIGTIDQSIPPREFLQPNGAFVCYARIDLHTGRVIWRKVGDWLVLPDDTSKWWGSWAINLDTAAYQRPKTVTVERGAILYDDNLEFGKKRKRKAKAK